MITPTRHAACCALLCLALVSTAHAQGTAFTYQGRLNSGGAPASGSYDVAFTLYATNVTGNAVAGPVTNSAVTVSNGLFATAVDFGPGVFTGTNYWLELAVSTNGANAFSTLAPRQQLTPVPYAIFAESASAAGLAGTIPAADISGNYGNPVDFNNGQNSFDGTFSGLFFGSSFVGGTFVGSGSGLSDVWHTSGNFGTVPAVNYLGTADNQPLIIKVNSNEAFRFEPTTDTPNVVGGYSGNSVQSGLYGVTIAGGGTAMYGGVPNLVTGTGNFATIGGGNNNNITGYGGVIAGGLGNTVGAYAAFVGAGQYNNAQSTESVIGGGQANFVAVNSDQSTIAGGLLNNIQSISVFASIGGGAYNSVQTNSPSTTIAGGYNNAIAHFDDSATIGGGAYNSISNYSDHAAIGGGSENAIQSSSDHATIAGGFNNSIQGTAWDSAIAGGYGNVISPFAQYAFIGGGNVNSNSSIYSVIGGGYYNTILAGDSASVIAGGAVNTIQTNSQDSAIGGGSGNVIQPLADHATIAGGYNNSIQTNSWDSAIGGGYGNVIRPFAGFSVIGGGNDNSIQTNMPFSFIGGGTFNSISYDLTNTPVGFIGYAGVAGGYGNQANGSFSFVGGGIESVASGIGSAILGGNVYQYITTNGLVYYYANTSAKGISSTVLGGVGNQANGDFSLAAGYLAQANHPGTFVWADSQWGNFVPFSSTVSNEFSIRAQNGVRIQTDKGIHLNATNEPVIVRDLDVFATNAPAAKAGIGRWGLFQEPYNLTLGIPDTNVGDSFPRYFQVAKYATNGSYTSLMWVDQLGNVTAAGSINGNGGGLTGLNAGQLTSGIIPPNVLAGNYPNVLTMTNPANVFAGNGTGLTNVNAALLNGLSSTAFAPAAGSTNYIQNQTSAPQIASFIITGSATVGGAVSGSSFAGNGSGLTNVNAATLNGLASSNFWSTTGNAGTTPGVNFIGTSDGKNLLIRGGFVGIGRTNAVTGNDVFSVEAPFSTGYGGMYVDTAGAGAKPFYGYSFGGTYSAYHYVDGSDGNKWKLNVGNSDRITVQPNGNVGIGNTAPTNPLMMGSGAYCSTAGVWTSVSDRNAKEDFTPIAPANVLAKVAALPITQWKYKVEPQGVKHIGPVAQDFHDAFGLGDSDRAIGTIDESGVALAAIQGLNQKVESDNAALRTENAELKARLEKLERLVSTLAGTTK